MAFADSYVFTKPSEKNLASTEISKATAIRLSKEREIAIYENRANAFMLVAVDNTRSDITSKTVDSFSRLLDEAIPDKKICNQLKDDFEADIKSARAAAREEGEQCLKSEDPAPDSLILEYPNPADYAIESWFNDEERELNEILDEYERESVVESSSNPESVPIEQKNKESLSAPIHKWETYEEIVNDKCKGIRSVKASQRDVLIVQEALSDGLPKKEINELLAKNSSAARSRYQESGSESALNYINRVVQTAETSSRLTTPRKSKVSQLEI